MRRGVEKVRDIASDALGISKDQEEFERQQYRNDLRRIKQRYARERKDLIRDNVGRNMLATAYEFSRSWNDE